MKIRTGTIEEAYGVFTAVPELNRPLSPAAFASRAGNDALILVCELEQKLVGFKIGYALDSRIFYSWLGGVLPDFRKFGVAQRLLDYQESAVAKRGFHTIEVKTMNRFPEMIRFLVKNGYSVKGVSDFGSTQERILFVKELPGPRAVTPE